MLTRKNIQDALSENLRAQEEVRRKHPNRAVEIEDEIADLEDERDEINSRIRGLEDELRKVERERRKGPRPIPEEVQAEIDGLEDEERRLRLALLGRGVVQLAEAEVPA